MLTNGVPSTMRDALSHGPVNTSPSRSRPVSRRSIAGAFHPAAAATASRRGAASRKRPPSAPTTAYSAAGSTISPRLAGSVHGVVVHATASTGPSANTPFGSSRSGKRTNTDGDGMSAYSISASASAVRSVGHQWIARRPRWM
jgi:hypothetical protein